jgi:ssDNA-binding Zn-finger/Zn-ribbon topoisomerase 1
MGMYDLIREKCPSCGGDLAEMQSKLGPCSLTSFTLASAPKVVAADLDGALVDCPKCDGLFRVRVDVFARLERV